jgi:large conductance mechanosensitive channel
VFKEFKEFIAKGNLMELAVAFIMGVAFAAVVSAFTDFVFNPLIAMVIPGIDDLSGLGTFGEGGSVGAFLGAAINFVLVAIVIFFMVKGYNRMQRAQEAEEEAAGPSEEVQLLTEIRDSLRRG